jgi:cytochrome c oxidase cbb3-type subunit I/II
MFYNIYKTISLAPKVVKDEIVSAPRLKAAIAGELGTKPHRVLEGLPGLFAVLSFVAVAVGTFIELAPAVLSADYVEVNPAVKPYTPLQLQGRDIFVREGCYLCHSQMIRPLVSETLRYGPYSRPEESVYDRPFQWGSKRTGPDLARVGGKYPDLWHFRHMMDPRDVVPGSIMPMYPWLFKDKIDYGTMTKKLQVMKSVGVPYSLDEVNNAADLARAEARQISEGLKTQGVPAGYEDREIVALISYLQRLGADFKKGLIK